MPLAEAHIRTDRAARYLEQLTSHLGAMQHMRHISTSGHGRAEVPRVEHVEQAPGRAVIRFADGSWTLDATPDALTLRVEAAEPAALERLKTAIAARIAKIGRRDNLTVDWREADNPGEDRPRNGSAARTGPQPTRHRWWRRAGRSASSHS